MKTGLSALSSDRRQSRRESILYSENLCLYGSNTDRVPTNKLNKAVGEACEAIF